MLAYTALWISDSMNFVEKNLPKHRTGQIFISLPLGSTWSQFCEEEESKYYSLFEYNHRVRTVTFWRQFTTQRSVPDTWTCACQLLPYDCAVQFSTFYYIVSPLHNPKSDGSTHNYYYNNTICRRGKTQQCDLSVYVKEADAQRSITPSAMTNEVSWADGLFRLLVLYGRCRTSRLEYR